MAAMFVSLAILLSCTLAAGSKAGDSGLAPTVAVWSDMHESLNQTELLSHIRTLRSSLTEANIILDKIFYYKDVENYYADLGRYFGDVEAQMLRTEDSTMSDGDSEPIRHGLHDKRSPAIQCNTPTCLKGQAYLNNWPGPAYRNRAGNSFCRFVLGVSPGDAAAIAYIGQNASCKQGATADCSFIFEAVPAKQSTVLGPAFAGAFDNCQQVLQNIFQKCDTQSGRSVCVEKSSQQHGFGVEAILMNAPGGPNCNHIDSCKKVNCLKNDC